MTTDVQLDQGRLEAFTGQVVTDVAATFSSALVYVGDRLGLYEALDAGGPATPEELAGRTGTHPRMIREWLLNQAAGGYVEYDADTGRFNLPPEHAAALAVEGQPTSLQGVFQIAVAAYRDLPKVLEAFRTGKGLAWGDHDHELFEGTERFFRPGYEANLVAEWIPALGDVDARLRVGGTVADVGCGHGASTIIMAKAYPNARFFGFDAHAPSIEQARRLAAEEGVADRVTFEVSDAVTVPGGPYDLIAYFDALHDMARPDAALARAREVVADDGVVMVVEPASADRPEENFNPVGRLFYAGSTLVCTPSSLDEDGLALGAQAGSSIVERLARDAGFAGWRIAHRTPVNVVYEARP